MLARRRGLAFDRTSSVRSYDADGRLHVSWARISKSCVSPYLGREIPDYEALRLDPGRIYNLLRDPDELERAAPTFNGLPLLFGHMPVSADDHRPNMVIGATGNDAAFEAPYLTNSLVVWARAAIDAIESGEQRELSCGYRYRAVPEDGTHDGERYQLRMVDLVGNHLAVVPEGRVGAEAVIGDSAPWGRAPTSFERMFPEAARIRHAF